SRKAIMNKGKKELGVEEVKESSGGCQMTQEKYLQFLF
ncbi:hypothetical protein A2U01_0083657, partial [Trifolium medium]|nr:hypothetical protein [Trifolium medium]